MNQTDNTTTPDAAHVPPAADHTTAADAGSAPNGAAEAQGAAPSLEQRLSELEARHAEVSEAYLRAKAETENVRRRSEEEMAKARKFAVESFAESLLPVKDSLEAAVANPGANTAQVLEGVQATLRQLSQALERNKVVEVAPPAGTRFDPHQHQAISMIPAEQEPNTVVTVLQKGYLIAERVLRPALVTVAAPK
ncbi:nucleotide exchange factor GrpE [Azohydromonas lata]|uniref:nucleotide exchange factor GrpE n=1 Tax=Azohydromonas lata TaxID=45677 RepID=UPI000834236B|nr:nucleotide exchange factor GrpE [Azohydromonas lata]